MWWPPAYDPIPRCRRFVCSSRSPNRKNSRGHCSQNKDVSSTRLGCNAATQQVRQRRDPSIKQTLRRKNFSEAQRGSEPSETQESVVWRGQEWRLRPRNLPDSRRIAKKREMFDDGFGTVTRRPGVWKPLQTERVPYGARASLRLCGRGACDECPGPQS